MCSQFEPPRPSELAHIGLPPPDFQYPKPDRTTCYSTEPAPFLANEHRDRWLPGCFGLVPYPWGTIKLARSTYNARSETVATKNSFRAAWKNRRLAVIPVSSFYEPCYESGHPVRWRIERKDGRPFGLAGIWEHRFDDPTVTRWSFSMLTISAEGHAFMSRFHAPTDEKRSVVVLDDDDWQDWLSARSEEDIRSYLRLFDPETMTSSPAPVPPRKKKGSADKEA